MAALSLLFLYISLFLTSFNTVNSDANCENLSNDIKENIASYAPAVDKIINYYLNGPFKGETFKQIESFVDKFGSRITGSKSLEDSIDHMVEASLQNNLDNVHTEDFTVTAWIREEEHASLLRPRLKNLPILGLGYSVPTPPNGITARAIVVKSFDELHALSNEEVKGKIVVYDQPFTTYGETVQYRGRGASEAAKKGAVAALVRSATPFSIATPHTGTQSYEDNVTKIPVAAITHEDADYLWREQQRNRELVINLKMSSVSGPVTTRNFVSELLGTEEKDKVVVVSGHIDSWDVGDGAMDDAGGCFISWLAPIVLKTLDLRPKRTIRTILFSAEEIGIFGAAEYEHRHRNESDKLSFVMESDFGTFAPLGIMYEGSDEGECMVREILKLFQSINVTQISLQGAGPDIGVWTSQGISGGGLYNDNGEYFWFHHTEGDDLNVLDTDVMDLNGAFWTAFSYVVADMKYDIPRKK